MTLRTRLAALAAVILAVAVGVVGVVLSQSTRAALLDPIDERLEQLAREFSRIGDREDGPRPEPPDGELPRERRPEGRDAAMLRFVDGERDMAEASGFESEPDPLPEVEASVAEGLGPGGWRLVDLVSSDGELGFRAVTIVSDGAHGSFGGTEIPKGTRVVHVFARPLDSVDATVARLRWTAMGAALVALLLGALLTWVVVRQAFRPVEETIAVAQRIGEGDLSLRVPEPDRPAELRSLGRSINSMLGGIETAQAAEVAARGALTQFVADASHELRTPIAAILGHAELLESGSLDDETRGRSIGRISGEAARMQRLVDDLLTLASHDTGHLRPHRLVNLSGVIADAVEDARAIDAERTYTGDITDGVRVDGDEGQLTQVVGNLLANVRAHTLPGTTATVRLWRTTEGTATIEVSDDGPGVPAENRERLFERFYRAPGGGARPGAGLGLAIVAAIVSEHGGTLRLVDRPVGTTIEVMLPSPE